MNDNQYQEHAEKLTKDEVKEWYVELSQSNLIPKLTGRGAKLLIAPRGAGKSMLFRKAYFQCIEKTDLPFPAYVNYSNYARVDYASHNRHDYILVFRKWVLGKILLAAFKTFEDLGKKFDASDLNGMEISKLEVFTRALEGGTYDPIDMELSPESVSSILIEIAKKAGRNRAVLLLDDAAHAFTPELQKEFFGIFRALSTVLVSPKAAVYPGITSYGDKFHSGHDAEVIKIGVPPEAPDYLNQMLNILRARLSKSDYSKLEQVSGLLETLAYASSGIPRGLIVMARHCLEGNDESGRTGISMTNAWDSIIEWNRYIRQLFQSIASKVPRYKHYISAGDKLLVQFLDQIRKYNAQITEKTIYIAVEFNQSPRYSTVIQYLEYAGILFERPDVSRGNRGIYSRYMVHIGMLIENRAIVNARGKSLKGIEQNLSKISNLFPQLVYNSLLDGHLDETCQLDLPPCPRCGNLRAFPEAKYCTSCGNELIDAPMYGELIKQPISELPLSEKKINAMLESKMFVTVSDLLQPNVEQRLQKLPRIGPIRAAEIVSVAEEFALT